MMQQARKVQMCKLQIMYRLPKSSVLCVVRRECVSYHKLIIQPVFHDGFTLCKAVLEHPDDDSCVAVSVLLDMHRVLVESHGIK